MVLFFGWGLYFFEKNDLFLFSVKKLFFNNTFLLEKITLNSTLVNIFIKI